MLRSGGAIVGNGAGYSPEEAIEVALALRAETRAHASAAPPYAEAGQSR